MDKLKALTPGDVWMYFEEICTIPRPSKKEEKIIAYLLEFGSKHNLVTRRDKIGNVVIKKPATPGMENRKTVVLQSHVDMVCEKNATTDHDFDKDPIKPFIDGNWVKAEGTTLGADDGIGIASQLAVLTSKDIPHGPIECLFTVDEESGLTGALELEPGFIDGKILLNLDSEDEGELFIGCAGGMDTLATMYYTPEKPGSNNMALQISVTGLRGGHSGDEIEKGLGNSNKILNRLLWQGTDLFNLRLSNFNGGNLRNAIPREAFAIVTLPADKKEAFIEYADKFAVTVKEELSVTEPGLTLEVSETEMPDTIIDSKAQFNLLNALYACPHGVIAWSQDIKGLVETSTNLASVKFIENNQIFITTSQRSSVESSKRDIGNMVSSVFRLADAEVKQSNGYPGWTPDTNSEILQITESAYKKLFSQQPVVRAIHAGLECGLFLQKYPELDMISFGPTIKGAHSPDERLDIETTQKFWKLLLEVLNNIPDKK
ncbi:MAG TPA: aminoacyl-histidine dipeptidase [Bacteroidales bacterium]|nr:aminoacyl-histidine dipeptidase [Bacteroidales bacterium]